MSLECKSILKLPHHEQQEYCHNRPPYRQGRKLTAVKVYTVNDESQHLLVFGVPQIKLRDELLRLACRFGIVKSLTLVQKSDEVADEDENRKFTDTYHLHYRRIQAARFAKRQLDERCFFGGVLHVCYAPELETVAETRIKLIQRRREVAARIEANRNSGDVSTVTKTKVLQRSRKRPALPLTEERLQQANADYNCNSDPALIVSTSTQNQSFPCLLKPSPSLLQACNTDYGSLSLPEQMYNKSVTVGIWENQMKQSSMLPITSGYVYTNNKRIDEPSTSGDVPVHLSNEEMKTLCFVPRQISVPSTSIKKPVKKRIVFHK